MREQAKEALPICVEALQPRRSDNLMYLPPRGFLRYAHCSVRPSGPRQCEGPSTSRRRPPRTPRSHRDGSPGGTSIPPSAAAKKSTSDTESRFVHISRLRNSAYCVCSGPLFRARDLHQALHRECQDRRVHRQLGQLRQAILVVPRPPQTLALLLAESDKSRCRQQRVPACTSHQAPYKNSE